MTHIELHSIHDQTLVLDACRKRLEFLKAKRMMELDEHAVSILTGDIERLQEITDHMSIVLHNNSQPCTT